ncbi:type VII secretion protein EccCa [Dactylosporangium sp. CA-233914]|uniref:type VII secretion protein EccCa n=1 Tax=Dactylosporangium sp. CA-233914 TaxID=3239934 RepID=UPI003D906BF1
MSRIAFHRPARYLLPKLPEERMVLPVPPEMPQENPTNSGWSLVLPLLSSVGMAAYMVTFGRPALIIIGVLFFLTSTGAIIAMRFNQRGNANKALRKQRQRYRAVLKRARDQARAVADGQRTLSALNHPEPTRLWAIAGDRRRVWERRPGDPDFLRIRVGLGEASLATPMQLDEKLDPLGDYDWESAQAADRMIERLAHVDNQPTIVDVGNAGVISVLGPPERTHETARAILCQIAVTHAPDDVLIAVETSGDGSWDWAKWLPHANEPRARGQAGVRSLVAGGAEDLADFLTAELSRRLEQQANRRMQLNSEQPAARRLVVVFTGFAPVSEWGRSPLLGSLVSAAGATTGITLMFLVERESDEPSRVGLRLRVERPGEVRVDAGADLVVTGATTSVPDQVPETLAELVARQLAPLRLFDEREQVLARTFSLTEMVLGGDVATVDIAARWAGPGDPRLLRAPIGSNGEGDTVVLDLKESAQGGFGPHGLIVGATGSGKSELLRTLITGLALTHSSDLLSFVLVDFKGGAAFAPLAELPHVAGLITNLADDAAMIDRVLAALIGEQQRRQRLLRDAGNLDSIREYQVRRGAGGVRTDGRPLEPLPYLLIVVDEFGELLSGRPDFVDLFLQIGRVGRSLGMHLLLATQRLEEGRLRGLDSHLSYRICLRTFSAAESRVVIGTPDAYQLPSIPGSAYLKVDESIYQRLRVAHVSARYLSQTERAAAAGRVDTTVVPFDLRGPADDSWADPDDMPPTGPGPTELHMVVDRLKGMIGPVHQVWLPPLPAALALDHLIGTPSQQAGRGYSAGLWPHTGRLRIPMGIIDIPVRQLQETLMVDFGGAHGHLAAVGAPRTGRSTLLRTLMLAGMLTHTPEEMQFYCIDFGGGSLHTFADAPHVGGVAGRHDPELISRMLAEIRALIGERERLFRSLGVDSIDDFRARRQEGRLPAGTHTADVFLLIDNWGAVRTEYENADPLIAEIAARGLGAGIHLVLTVGRWMDIRSALRDSIGTRVELRLNDPTESEVNRRMAARMPADQPGRGLVGPGAYFQLVLPRIDGKDTAEGLREAQATALAAVAAGWTGRRAAPVRLLPARIGASEVERMAGPDEAAVPIGIAEDNLLPVALDLVNDEHHLLVFGDSGAGKTTLLRTWITGLTDRHSAFDLRIVLFDFRHTLLDAVPADYLGAYAGDSITATEYVKQVVDKLTERIPPSGITPQQLRDRDWWQGPEIYVVVDDYDLVAGGTLAPLAAFVPQAREVGLHLVLARRVSGINRMLGDQLVNRVKDIGCDAVVLAGDPREGAVIGDVRAAARPPGRGHLVRRGRPPRLIQVAVPDASQSSV